MVKRKLKSVKDPTLKRSRPKKSLSPAERLKSRRRYKLRSKRKNGADHKFDKVRSKVLRTRRKPKKIRAGKALVKGAKHPLLFSAAKSVGRHSWELSKALGKAVGSSVLFSAKVVRELLAAIKDAISKLWKRLRGVPVGSNEYKTLHQRLNDLHESEEVLKARAKQQSRKAYEDAARRRGEGFSSRPSSSTPNPKEKPFSEWTIDDLNIYAQKNRDTMSPEVKEAVRKARKKAHPDSQHYDSKETSGRKTTSANTNSFRPNQVIREKGYKRHTGPILSLPRPT